MSLLLEAVLNQEWPTQEQFITGFAGLIKLGDLVSDVFFVSSLRSFEEDFGDLYPGTDAFIDAATVFTVIGFLFDAFKACVVVRERCNKAEAEADEDESEADGDPGSEEPKKWWEQHVSSLPGRIAKVTGFAADDEKKWKWWKRSNLILEEIPQLIILVAFYASIRGLTVNCDVVRDVLNNCPSRSPSPSPRAAPTPSPLSITPPPTFTPAPSPFFRRVRALHEENFDPHADHMLSRSWLDHSQRFLQTNSSDSYSEQSQQGLCENEEIFREACRPGQQDAQVNLSDFQRELYTSSIVSTLFTCITIAGVAVTWYRDSKQNVVDPGNKQNIVHPGKKQGRDDARNKDGAISLRNNQGGDDVIAFNAKESHRIITSQTTEVKREICGIRIPCDGTSSIGLSLQQSKDGHCIVTLVEPSGAAAVEGTVQPGDAILAVNGKNVVGPDWPSSRVEQEMLAASSYQQPLQLDVLRTILTKTSVELAPV